MIYRTQKDVCRLHINAMPFYIRGSGSLGFWYPWGDTWVVSWNQFPADTNSCLIYIPFYFYSIAKVTAMWWGLKVRNLAFTKYLTLSQVLLPPPPLTLDVAFSIF